MEKIRQGKKNIATCDTCDSDFRFRPGDVNIKHEGPKGPYEMEGCDCFYVICPDCNECIFISGLSSSFVKRVKESQRIREEDEKRGDYDL